MSLENQLAAYREKKAQEKQTLDSNADSSVKRVFQILNFRTRKRNMSKGEHESINESPDEAKERPSVDARIPSEVPPPTSSRWSHVNQDDSFIGRFLHRYTSSINGITILKLLLWLILWGLFIELEFGSVFFILSLFYFVYTSMRAGSRNKSELSAYSVFNPNFERLEGTFTAEQFEKELRYGAASVH